WGDGKLGYGTGPVHAFSQADIGFEHRGTRARFGTDQIAQVEGGRFGAWHSEEQQLPRVQNGTSTKMHDGTAAHACGIEIHEAACPWIHRYRRRRGQSSQILFVGGGKIDDSCAVGDVVECRQVRSKLTVQKHDEVAV